MKTQWWRSLGWQMVVATALGISAGLAIPGVAIHFEILGDAFLNLIRMAIVPLILPLIVLAIVHLGSLRSVGRLAGKSIAYFEVVTTIIIVFGVLLGNLTNVSGPKPTGIDIGEVTQKTAEGLSVEQFVHTMIPENIISAMSQGDLLALVIFGVIFGIAMIQLGERVQGVTKVLDQLSQIMFGFVRLAIRLSPVGVFGFLGYNVAKYGTDTLMSLGHFVLVAFIGMLFVAVVLFGAIAMIFRVNYLDLLRSFSDILFLGFVTRSSEALLPMTLERLGKYGVDSRIASFVMPMGYSFNADGTSLYQGLALLFVAHTYGIDLSIGQQITMMLLLMLLTKGIAGVPSSSLVVLMSAATVLGLPAEGVALLFSVDFIVDAGRTVVTMIGNCLATVIVAKSEGQFRRPGLPEKTTEAVTA
ncbi:dicarboxylate/amino acid:cation symporter [Streptomyces sp. MCA2]|uniref:dicarboxylate/amino acid:cation symporter n=1 Tax=Streptomyces sp. MCA2 TaxID=2944805 RepID=UPI00202239F7|nr:dicarboxylate/amino acid:cation symporter [Streptomyces sp. MCA2]MCL7492526.1 dicarboxylate/amino acid:cation symporter [Streptomyces sp. MCA2]